MLMCKYNYCFTHAGFHTGGGGGGGGGVPILLGVLCYGQLLIHVFIWGSKM